MAIRLVGPFVEPLLERFMVLDLDTRNLVIKGDAGQSAAHRTVHNRIIVIHESSLRGEIAFANFFLRSAEFFSRSVEHFWRRGTFHFGMNSVFGLTAGPGPDDTAPYIERYINQTLYIKMSVEQEDHSLHNPLHP